MLDAVEPALSGEHVAHAHQAHGVVRFGEILVQRSRARADDKDQRGQRPAGEPGDPSVTPRSAVVMPARRSLKLRKP